MTNEAMSTENQDNQQFSPGIVSGLLKGLKNEKESSEFSDVQIKVDNYEFRCHRVVLAACSGFFKAVFTSGMKEDLERKVILQEISRETFADVLECMYAGRNVINDTNVFDIWHAANQLQILFLLHECEVFLKQKINPENCLAIYQHGKLLDSKEMVQFSWSYIVDNFESIRRSEELMMLTKEEMEAFIASPDLKTISEDHVLETVLSWVDYKPTELFDETNELVYKCDTPGQTQKDGSQSENISYAGHNQDISAVND
ncbi:unnamed protein product [Candidula unifasciata]|uniref:BTB domain-containing protein n=1 Tax=Candidula unifasciata TaxID=100452 RepID=A0A8S3Z7A6_9EUPU|nr:unnamed protein product [Candidula unifasciata]